ncbi:MAG: hypothetical protein M1820_004196 [Bogoriella megaspora]|nr:MAG: hypothetical protein M1820_004196 [Bogoriella megaspora]
MKAIFTTIVSLVAAAVFVQGEDVGTQFGGSLAARAGSEVQAGEAAAVQFCALSPSVLGNTNNPARPANLDVP